MNLLKTILFIFYLATAANLSYGQSGQNNENSDEPKILNNIIQFNYTDKAARTLKIPKRKYDSPFFCTEIEQYKNGFIINSTTSNPEGLKILFTTRFYYYNTIDRSIKKILLSNADTIEAIVSTGNTIFYSIIKNGKRVIGELKNGQELTLNDQAPLEISKQIDTAKWIKLGFCEEKLYALSPNYLFQVSGNQWKQLTKYSIDDFYINVLKYKHSLSMLPTRNIVIKNNSVYFLQEVVQQRTCSLFKLNINNGTLEDYFLSIDYKDNYLKQVNDFIFLDDNSLLVSASRLLYNNIVINTKEDKVNVWSYKNILTTKTNSKIQFPITTALNIGDTIILASARGLYFNNSTLIMPLVYFSNYHQSIKSSIGLIDFNFFPRSIKQLSANRYLLGGMWGGLYQIDISANTVICLDDIDYDKLKSIDINLL